MTKFFIIGFDFISHDNRNNSGTELITTHSINFPITSSRSCDIAAVKGGTQANYLKRKSQQAGR